MPELPEVETIRRQLAGRIEGRVIEGATVSDARLVDPWAAADFDGFRLRGHGGFAFAQITDVPSGVPDRLRNHGGSSATTNAVCGVEYRTPAEEPRRC